MYKKISREWASGNSRLLINEFARAVQSAPLTGSETGPQPWKKPNRNSRLVVIWKSVNVFLPLTRNATHTITSGALASCSLVVQYKGITSNQGTGLFLPCGKRIRAVECLHRDHVSGWHSECLWFNHMPVVTHCYGVDWARTLSRKESLFCEITLPERTLYAVSASGNNILKYMLRTSNQCRLSVNRESDYIGWNSLYFIHSGCLRISHIKEATLKFSSIDIPRLMDNPVAKISSPKALF